MKWEDGRQETEATKAIFAKSRLICIPFDYLDRCEKEINTFIE